MADLMLTITYFAFLLGLGVLIANLLKKRHIPDTFFLLVLGLLLGPTIYANPFIAHMFSMTLVDVSQMGNIPDFLRVLALILIVFTGTFSLGFRAFKKFSTVALNLAIFGVLVNTLVIGVVAQFIFGFGWIYSFLLAAVLSGTCSSVILVFKEVMSKRQFVFESLKIESILNSPLSVLIPLIVISFISIAPGTLINPLIYLNQFGIMITLGIGVGIVMGIGVSKLLRSMLREYSALLVFSIALITYAIAELWALGSGMLAVAVCGLISGDLVFTEKKEIVEFDDQLSQLFRISVFTLLGAQVFLVFNPEVILMTVVFFLIIMLFRPVFLVPIVKKTCCEKLTKRDLALMSFVAPRGLSAAAMAPVVAFVLINAPLMRNLTGGNIEVVRSVTNQMINIIFVVILLSIFTSTIFVKVLSRQSKEELDEPVKDKNQNNENMTDWLEKNIEKETKNKIPKGQLMDELEREAS